MYSFLVDDELLGDKALETIPTIEFLNTYKFYTYFFDEL